MSTAGSTPAADPIRQALKRARLKTTHVKDYFDALSRQDAAAIAEHPSGDLALLHRVFPASAQGRAAVVQVATALLATIEEIEVEWLLASDRDVQSFAASLARVSL